MADVVLPVDDDRSIHPPTLYGFERLATHLFYIPSPCLRITRHIGRRYPLRFPPCYDSLGFIIGV